MGFGPSPTSKTRPAVSIFPPGVLRDDSTAPPTCLVGVPSTYRLRTPRGLNLRWNEFAFYGETELRPTRGLQVTLGLRFESQPPAVDRLDRVAAFREDVTSQRFSDTLPNLIFPGDPDGDSGPLPRSTIRTDGRHLSPRLGVTFSPTWESPLSRWILGESGRSVFRASYGVFHDFGTFAGFERRGSAASHLSSLQHRQSVRFRENRAAAGKFQRSSLRCADGGTRFDPQLGDQLSGLGFRSPLRERPGRALDDRLAAAAAPTESSSAPSIWGHARRTCSGSKS